MEPFGNVLQRDVANRPPKEEEARLASIPRLSTRTRRLSCWEPSETDTDDQEDDTDWYISDHSDQSDRGSESTEDNDARGKKVRWDTARRENDSKVAGLETGGERSGTDNQRYLRERAEYDALLVSNKARKREARVRPLGHIRFTIHGDLEHSKKKAGPYSQYTCALHLQPTRIKKVNMVSAEVLEQCQVLTDAKAPWLGSDPRAHGLERLDRTCYNRSQYRWGTTHENYPKVIFRYERKGLQNDPRTVGELTWNGKLVIDWWLQPVNDYKHIPRVLASEYEGCFMEASMRLHDEVTIRDLQARIFQRPPMLHKRLKNGHVTLVRLWDRNALAIRMGRFRRNAGCITWRPRRESEVPKRFMDCRLKAENWMTNNIETLGDLTTAEKIVYDG
ncbi:MAG: hypothetical protein Q9163_001307 [Psora crenata]